MQNEAFWNCVGAISIRGFRIVATCSVNCESCMGVLTGLKLTGEGWAEQLNP